MKYQYTIGIDMGKHTFHCCIYHQDNKLASFQVNNNSAGFKQLEKVLKGHRINPKEVLFCAEHTGIYNGLLLQWISKKGYLIWLENPLAIKKSMGLQRGKSDPIDAQRIAQYAVRFVDQAKLWQPTRAVIEELRGLLRLRERLMKAKNQLQAPLKESQGLLPASLQKQLAKSCSRSLSGLKKDIAELENRIEAVLSADKQLDKVYQVVESVQGIGKYTALELLIVSNEFKGLKTAKACACYAGIAPFEYSSGSSIRRKSRVSHLANKRLKTLLHMAALSSVRLVGDLKAYYDRKVAEGKSKMLVLNAVRNKLLQRVYSCVREMRLYKANYVPLAA